MKAFLFGSDNNGPANTGTGQFNRLNSIFTSSWTGTEPPCQIVIPVTMDLSRFYVQLDTAPGLGMSYTFTIIKNGVATALEIVIADLAVSAVDTTHAISFAPGDTVSVRAVPLNTPATPSNHFWNIQVDTAGKSAPLLTGLPAMSSSLTRYGSMLAGHGAAAGWSTTETDVQVLVPAAGTLSNLYIKTATAPGASKSYEITVMKNGSATPLQITLAGLSTSGSDAVNTVPVSAGDSLTIRSVPINSPAGIQGSFGIAFTPTNTGENFMGFGSSSAPSVTVANYEQLLGIGVGGWNATESGRYMMPGPCTLRGLYVKLITPPGVGASRTFTVRKSTGDTVLVATISDTNTTASVLANVECAQGELLTFKSTISGTPAAATGGVHMGLLLYNDPKSPVVMIY
jgi:hypothetical protein